MGYKIWVWESVPEFSMGPNHALTVAVRTAVTITDGKGRVNPADIGKALEAMPGVVVYEILDPQGHGASVYSGLP